MFVVQCHWHQTFQKSYVLTNDASLFTRKAGFHSDAEEKNNNHRQSHKDHAFWRQNGDLNCHIFTQ